MIIETIRKNKVTTFFIGLYFILLFVISLALVNVYSDIYKQEYVLVHDNLERLNMLHQLKGETSLMLLNMQNGIISNDRNKSLETSKTHLANYRNLSKKLANEDAPESRKEIIQIETNALPEVEKIIQSIEANKSDEAKRIFSRSISDVFNNWFVAIDKAIKFENTNNRYAFENIRQQQDKAARICVVVAVLVCPLLTITSLSFYFNRRKEELHKA